MDQDKNFKYTDAYIRIATLNKCLNTPQEDYKAPALPLEIPEFEEYKENTSVEFGAAMKKHFHLTDEFCFLNHGAFGCTLKEALKTSQDFQAYVDSQPLRALNREIVPYLAHSLRQMAAFVGCDPHDLAFVENATCGINAVLKSLMLEPGDEILTTSFTYGAVQKSVNMVCERTGATECIVKLDFPIREPEQVIGAIERHLSTKVKLAILDHVPSTEAFIFPVKKLIKLCKERGILVLIDGAHTLGQFDLNIMPYDADFYVTNCHKWFSNTRGSALLYVRRQLQSMIRPLVVSWGYKCGFTAEFLWSGTQYYSQYISLLTALNFWQAIGPSVIQSRCHKLVLEAEKLLLDSWNVPKCCPDEMMGMMALVRLPDALNDENWLPNSGRKRLILQDYLYFEHKIEATIRMCNGMFYTRISCHVYNELSDYQKLADAVLEMCKRRDSLTRYNTQFKL